MPHGEPLEATKNLKRVMGDYLAELGSSSKPVAWCTSVGPAELLQAMGFTVYFPENHGAMLGASRMAVEVIPRANAIGYSPDICSYLTSDIGSYLAGKSPLQKAGLGGPPKPDVLVFNTNQCRDVYDWFGFYAREWNVPLIGVRTHRSIGLVDDRAAADIAAQIEALVPDLERVGGDKFDFDRLREAVDLSAQCSDLWKQVLDAAEAVPAPWTFFDHTIHMAPAVVLRGRVEAVEYYRLLLKELNRRIAAGSAAVVGERRRVYWDGMPIWGKLRNLADLFASLNTSVVASTYCNSWIFSAFDQADPFASMARAYTELFIVRDETCKEEYIVDQAARFKVDGFIFHDAKTCPNNSNNRYGLPQRLTNRLDLPSLTINGDLNDLRCYSEEQAKTNIEAFIEQLDEAG